MIDEQTSSKRVLSNTKLIVALAVLVVCVTALLIVPRIRAAQSTRVEIVRLESEIEELSASDELIGRLTQMRDDLKRFGAGRVTVIPERNDVAGLVTQLSTTFDEAGLKGREITSQNAKVVEDVIKTPMVVRASGRFPQIYEVIRHLEHMPRLLRVGRLRIERETRTARGTVSRDPEVKADILIEAFYEDPSQAGTEREGR